MSTVICTTPTELVGPDTEPRPRLWRAGVAYGAVAATATCLIVLAARAGGVDVAIDGEKVPLDGFALFTLVGALIGVLLAMTFSRRARDPRTAFVRTTVALTVLSIVPDVVVDATTGSKVVLALTHVVAAAIIVPAIAARLSH